MILFSLRTWGNIILCGDFNARTGNASDFIPDDHNQFSPYLINTKLTMILLIELVEIPVLIREGKSH